MFERDVGLEPTLFHIGSVMPYQLGESRDICYTKIQIIFLQNKIYFLSESLKESNRLSTVFLLVEKDRPDTPMTYFFRGNPLTSVHSVIRTSGCSSFVLNRFLNHFIILINIIFSIPHLFRYVDN